MTQPPANCPRCESEQAFVPKLRETEHRWQELVIRCTVCRWESVLRQTTPEIETIAKQIDGYNRIADRNLQAGKQDPATLVARRRTLRQRYAKLIGELAQEVRDGEPADNRPT